MTSKYFNSWVRFCLCLLLMGYYGCINCWAQSTNLTPQDSLFDSDEILQLKISGNTRALLKDREKKSSYHSFTLSYNIPDAKPADIPVKIKTRGHFRKMSSNCYYPPLSIQFPANATQAAGMFSGSKKLKLVMPCKDDKYVIREWMLYKLYQVLTPASFKARLVKVILHNEKNNKEEEPVFGIILEEETRMAQRNKAELTERKMTPAQTDRSSFLTMAVFQYLICNTDWSIQYLQNIKLLLPKGRNLPVPVAYDFDHAGLVNAPYAMPAEELLLSSVTERRFRGYCITNMEEFEEVFRLFNSKKAEIYQLYASCSLLDDRFKETVVSSLNVFYNVINNPEKAKKEFNYPCDKNGTGNVVIKGLRED